MAATALVYNGEIYNFQEIRTRLEAQGSRFRTRSDTEVLLEAWVRWGPACLPDFDGIFAFAIWDAHERTLLLARDRLGVKPLFYSPGTNSQRDFACASTLSPFWKLSGQDRGVDYPALCDYLAQHFFSGPGTILASVRELEPGTWLRWQADSGQTQITRYWDLPAVTDQPMELPDLVEAADAALRGSIRRQLVSDVDLGVFFSGGIDSSLVAYYMREITGKPPRTFTVKFDHSPGYPDEAADRRPRGGCPGHEPLRVPRQPDRPKCFRPDRGSHGPALWRFVLYPRFADEPVGPPRGEGGAGRGWRR